MISIGAFLDDDSVRTAGGDFTSSTPPAITPLPPAGLSVAWTPQSLAPAAARLSLTTATANAETSRQLVYALVGVVLVLGAAWAVRKWL